MSVPRKFLSSRPKSAATAVEFNPRKTALHRLPAHAMADWRFPHTHDFSHRGRSCIQFCSLTETTTVTGSYRLPAPFRCSAPHSPPGWPVSQVQKDECRSAVPKTETDAIRCRLPAELDGASHRHTPVASPNFTRISRDTRIRQLFGGFSCSAISRRRGVPPLREAYHAAGVKQKMADARIECLSPLADSPMASR